MSVNLFVKVGRADPQCVGTFADEESASAARVAKSAELLREGHAPERVSFYKESATVAVKAKKGSK